MASKSHPMRRKVKPQPGFTLVEMLVAVTLTLLMMTLFAQVFQMAGSSISKQRGLAENDQRSRTLQTIIKADLDKRTNRWVYPFAAGEDVSAPESYIGKRQGYLCISENNPTNKVDDTLQFTMSATITARNKDTSPYYGKATTLANSSSNQPDADDSQAAANNTGTSTVAEVVYFVRNGNLYRRQLLVREPLAAYTATPQPSDVNNNDLFNPASSAYTYGANQFWNDFDYQAYMTLNGGGTPYAVFPGTDALDNSGKTLGSVALGKPQYRFGFSPLGLPGIQAGRPKEFADSSVGASFIGRFTMQECSDADFKYPQAATSAGNVPTDPSLALTLDPFDSTVVGPDDFSQGPRRGEDLLLTNVHAFDIQLWDVNNNSFVNIADPALPNTADFAQVKRSGAASSSYGPRITENVGANAINAMFDTWHPQVGLDFNGDGTVPEPPPFHPITFRPDYLTGAEPTPNNTAGISSWQAAQKYVPGDVVFPTQPVNPAGSPFFYRCIDNNQPPIGLQNPNVSNNVAEPGWPKVDGLTVADNAIVWQAVDNRKPLKAIKIEIRFVDPSTQQMRQLTIIQSLVD